MNHVKKMYTPLIEKLTRTASMEVQTLDLLEKDFKFTVLYSRR